VLGIVEAEFALQTLTVKSNVPVRGIINEVKKARDNGVKAISYFLSDLFILSGRIVSHLPSLH
jgi:hypothetical protein